MVLASSLPLGSADCEVVGGGWLTQPVNAWSSLAYAVVGVALIVSLSQGPRSDRTTRVVFGLLMVATGIGSHLYHGPQPAGAEFAHDITFLVMLWALILVNPASGYGIRKRVVWIALGLVTAAAAFILTVAPTSTNILTGVSVAGLVVSDLLVRRIGTVNRPWYAAALLLFAVSLVFNILGRSGMSTCDPDSIIQFHALWHGLSAVAIGAYFVATTVPRNQEPTS